MAEYESWELRLAWQEMLQVRGCPPDAVLHGSGPTPPGVLRHLRLCPFCPDRVEDMTTGMSTTSNELFPFHGRPTAGSESLRESPSPSGLPTTRSSSPEDPGRPPNPGEIRSIRRSLGGWGPKGLFYNPPLVLVVSVPEAPPEAVRVAQVHPAAPLAGPGDVEVTPGLFAECWNTYPLRRADLGEVWAVVSDELLQAVASAVPEPLRPAEGVTAPWIEAFRRLEIEVGAFFSLQAVDALLREGDESPFDRVLAEIPDVEVLEAHLRDRRPRVILPEESFGVLECLALARFPEGELPLAAAGAENRIILNRVAWSEEGIELSPLGAELTHWEVDPGGLTSGGVIEATSPEGSELRAWLHVEGGAPLPAADVSFDPAQGFFRARFPDIAIEAAREGRLVLLLCHPPAGGSPSADGE